MKQFFIWNNIHQIIHSKTTTSQKFGGSKFDQIQSQQQYYKKKKDYSF